MRSITPYKITNLITTLFNYKTIHLFMLFYNSTTFICFLYCLYISRAPAHTEILKTE